MNISIDKNPATSALVRMMADKDYSKAQAAREAFAAFITGPILEALNQEPVIGNLFTTMTYDYGTPATIPLAALFDVKSNDFIKVWSQVRPGGLATSSMCDVTELPVMTYGLMSAVSFSLNYVRAARIDVVAAFLERMAQEFLYKQEMISANVLATTAAQSQYLLRGNATYQVLRSQTQNQILPQDINRLVTLMSRQNPAYNGGTPVGASRAITTLIGSPEFMEQIRNMAFQNVNTNGAAIPSSDKFRDDIYNAPVPSIYGMELLNVYDLGVGQAYNILFSNAAGSTAYQGYGQSGTAVFSAGSEQVVFAIDRRRKFLVRMVETSPENSATLEVAADNQWSNRSEEIGFYAKLREGRVSLDGRNICTLIF